eukprot:NODE_10518_length_1346_cov_3.393765.p1 GENE.NODE_10518_length_1346_cov_3.393765~~NODE_10518_length_1346_cov_3.393765.p1  ORF type:complete len:355 (+),score=131.75 NODE_10518_length_1346_cov_3.393765:67-1131(+)
MTARIRQVTFLGTAAAAPSPGKRNVSALALSTQLGAVLVDCGEATQHQLGVCTALKASQIAAICITHMHGDHCFGIFGLLAALALEGRKEPIDIVGPVGLREMVETVLRLGGGWTAEDHFLLRFTELNPAMADVPCGRFAGLEVRAYRMVHSIAAFGFVFREPEELGRLDAANAIALGCPQSALGRLKGGQDVSVEVDGRTVTVSPADCVGPPRPGRVVAVLQDTSDASTAAEACLGADLVIHECTFEASMRGPALEKGHSTTQMAAEFAQAVGAKRLCLTHFSTRYVATSTREDRGAELAEEASRFCSCPVNAACDFLVLDGGNSFVPRKELARKRSIWDVVEQPAATKLRTA